MRPNNKSCKHCGRAFTPATKYTLLCPECHDKAKSGGVVQTRTCRACGATFPGGPRAWYCPQCRTQRQRAQDKKYKRTGAMRKLGSTDRCIKCGQPYIVQSGTQKYCPDCAAEAVNATVREHKRQYAADHADQYAAYKAEMPRNRHVCVICGTVYDSDKPTVTCSADCDKIRRQRNQQRADAKRAPRNKRKEQQDENK